MSRGDRAIGIALGLVLGITIVILFVFLGSGDTIDSPSIENVPSTVESPAATGGADSDGESRQP